LFNFINVTFSDGLIVAGAVPIISPQTNNWPIEKILGDINKINPEAKIFPVFNSGWFNPHSFALESIKSNYKFSIGYYFNDFKEPDFYILKTGRNTYDIDFRKAITYVLDNKLTLIKTYSLPDHAMAQVFKNIK